MGKCIVVKLRHPGSERVLDFVATEDAKLDVGTISRSFGLNPSSVKFNDIYVSRGPDFISSVTWSNLLGYFLKKGYSTGKSEQDAILVDGKPCDLSGTWIHDNHLEDPNLYKPEEVGAGGKRRIRFEDSMIVNVLKKRKILQENFDVNLWEIYNHSQQFQEEGNSYYNKRAHVEDAGEMDVVKKQMRVHRDSDVDFKSHLKQNEYIVQNAGDSLNLNCNMELKKRTRSDEMLAFSPRKRAR
jgi:hypothetical protein